MYMFVETCNSDCTVFHIDFNAQAHTLYTCKHIFLWIWCSFIQFNSIQYYIFNGKSSKIVPITVIHLRYFTLVFGILVHNLPQNGATSQMEIGPLLIFDKKCCKTVSIICDGFPTFLDHFSNLPMKF